LGIEISDQPIPNEYEDEIRSRVREFFNYRQGEENYMVFVDSIENNAYDPQKDSISLLNKDGSLIDVAQAADQLNINALSHTVRRYFICYPKEVRKG
jgi:hypothetical protein